MRVDEIENWSSALEWELNEWSILNWTAFWRSQIWGICFKVLCWTFTVRSGSMFLSLPNFISPKMGSGCLNLSIFSDCKIQFYGCVWWAVEFQTQWGREQEDSRARCSWVITGISEDYCWWYVLSVCSRVLNVLMLLSLCNAVMMGVDLVPTLKWKLGAKQLSSVGVKDMYPLPLALCLYCTVMVTHPSLR